MDKEYLTIKEFAALTGTTTQAVYKQLPTKLQPYCKTIGNKKVLSYEALKEFNATELATSCKPVTNQVANELPTSLQPVANQENVENLRELINLLKEQLQTKDTQLQTQLQTIDKLTEKAENELKAKDRQIENLNNTLNLTIQELNKRIEENNHLQHENNQVLLSLKEKQEKAPADDPIVEVHDQEPEVKEQPKENKSWFKRLFKIDM